MFSFESLLNSSPEITDYFVKHAQTPQDSFKLAQTLLIEAVRNRVELQKTLPIPASVPVPKPVKSPKAHYNVAYVKHERFLSPSQKRQVTPKVTEIIPVSPEKVFIYGKPKVKLDDGYGCPLHEENCEEYAYSNVNQSQDFSTHEKENQYPSDEHGLNQSSPIQEVPRQYEEYLSPKNKPKKKNSKKQTNFNQTVGTIRSPKNKNQNAVQTRVSNQNIQNLQNISRYNGPRMNDTENLAKVQSKIKELIQRDKRNREIQKQVEKQRQQILEIQERQNRLLMMQKYQQNILKEQTIMEHGNQNEVWKITTSPTKQQLVIGENMSETSEIEGSQDEFVAGYHGHQTLQQKSDCYDCEIERLRRRKEKAKQAIKSIDREERRRSKMFQSIVNKEQTILALAGHPRQSENSIMSRSSMRAHGV